MTSRTGAAVVPAGLSRVTSDVFVMLNRVTSSPTTHKNQAQPNRITPASAE
jgi:hypothetical protein